MILSMVGGYAPVPSTTEAGLNNYLAYVSQDIESFDHGELFEFKVGGAKGLSVNVSGIFLDREINGKIAFIMVDDLQFFIAFGLATPDRWISEGENTFTTVLSSVSFFTPTPMDGICPVSADPTFGYSEDNPIKIGEGDPFIGPSLERAYLDLLYGPNGQSVSYERIGSLSHGDTILDLYSVSYDNPATTVTLYLDIYERRQLRIPMGFSCGP